MIIHRCACILIQCYDRLCGLNELKLVSCGGVICIATDFRTERPRVRSSTPCKVKSFHFSISSRLALGCTQPPIQLIWEWGSYPMLNGWGVKLTTHFQLVSRSTKRDSTSPPPHHGVAAYYNRTYQQCNSWLLASITLENGLHYSMSVYVYIYSKQPVVPKLSTYYVLTFSAQWGCISFATNSKFNINDKACKNVAILT
jgi:hypothetical protein